MRALGVVLKWSALGVGVVCPVAYWTVFTRKVAIRARATGPDGSLAPAANAGDCPRRSQTVDRVR